MQIMHIYIEKNVKTGGRCETTEKVLNISL